MKLSEILKEVKTSDCVFDPEVEIEGVAYDSRKVKPGYLFVALRGHHLDGHDYLRDAIENGAVALVAEEFRDLHGRAATIRVPDSRRALSTLAMRFYGYPFEDISLIGITGTNGKTTTSYLLESMLMAAGARPGVLGTINYRFSGKIRPAPVTTPESLDLMRLVREMADGGATHVIMEVSSHALDQKRTQDCPFKVAIFTNLSRDHLDYHQTMDEYFRAKSLLFQGLGKNGSVEGPSAVVNMDDPRGNELVGLTDAHVVTYGLRGKCHVTAHSIEMDKGGLRATLVTPLGEKKIRSRLIGEFNVYNILAASAAAVSLNMGLNKIAEGIDGLGVVPGRMELVQNRLGLAVVVDYAHTPDALLKTLQSLRPYVDGRVITVFGCGGDRDRGKRHEMGLVAGEQSDLVFITSDNPRSEDPFAIVAEIEKGVQKSGLKRLEWSPSGVQTARSGYFVEVDRRDAIRKAISVAHKADLLLIAGKGHEDYQIVGGVKRYFDDRKEAESAAEVL